jgi:hypothetical protein
LDDLLNFEDDVVSPKQINHWLCKECENPLSGHMGDLSVELRDIAGQQLELEYLSIIAKCKKCGTKQERQGLLMNDLYKIKELIEESKERNQLILKLVDMWEKGLLKTTK